MTNRLCDGEEIVLAVLSKVETRGSVGEVVAVGVYDSAGQGCAWARRWGRWRAVAFVLTEVLERGVGYDEVDK